LSVTVTATLLGVAVIAGQLPLQVRAQSNAELKEQIERLDQELRILKRKLEVKDEAAEETKKTTPVVTIGQNGLQVRSADTNFIVSLHGVLQADARFYMNSRSGASAGDTFLIRRARPIIDATMYEKYDFHVMMDFGSGLTSTTGNVGFLQDASVTARFLPEINLQVGKFKAPIGLERAQSDSKLLFTERSYPTQLVPNREVGAELKGDISNGFFTYEVGIFNGAGDGGSEDQEVNDTGKELEGRIFFQPLKTLSFEPLRGLGVGLGGSYGRQDGALSSYSTTGQQRFFSYGDTTVSPTVNVTADGDRWRLVPQAYYYWGPFGLYAEYAISEARLREDKGGATPVFVGAGDVRNTAWQIAGSYILTGEQQSFKGISVKNPFKPSENHWGAFEIAARYGSLSLDRGNFPLPITAASSYTKASSWSVGLNWYLNNNFKFDIDFESTDLSGAKTTLLSPTEQVVMTRFQLAF
jgi:phosphate-selective porin OprO/OprP